MADLPTILARLLRDGELRDKFRRAPTTALASFALSEEDQQALLALSPEDLEFQSRILRRKRFDLVRQLIPKTCSHLDEQGWLPFADYSRYQWPKGHEQDAVAFLAYLTNLSLLPKEPAERNLLRFLSGSSKLALYLVSVADRRGRARIRLQILYRRRKNWRQVHLYFGL